MHIPDGYLSPATCAAGYVAMVPIWTVAVRRVERVASTRLAPLLALGAAYAFLVMMLNLPIPGGTTAHAVGAVLIAILLGPWSAVIAVSIALLIQALLFGDGGVLTFGANAFNMAFLMPFAGVAVYRLVAGSAPLTARRRTVAAGLGAYVGLNVAALATAIELGLQPALASDASGAPLYAPYDLAETLPAMLLPHLAIAGLVEAALTAGVIAYLQRANLPLLRLAHPGVPDVAAPDALPGSRLPGYGWALAGVATMVVIAPLGLLAPGGAFGEDAPEEIDLTRYGLDAIPAGLVDYAGFWQHTVLADYGFADGSHARLAYVLSALVGALAVGAALAVIVFAVRRLGGGGGGAEAGESAA